MLDNQEVVTVDESDSDGIPKLEDASDGDRIQYPVENGLLLQGLFLMHKKTCSMIRDGRIVIM